MEPVDPIAFGKRLRERREELEWSQPEVGKAAGYSQQRIGSLEAGEVKRPDRAALALAAALYTTDKWLLWGTGPRSIGDPPLTDRQIVEKYRAAARDQQREVEQILRKPGRKRKIS